MFTNDPKPSVSDRPSRRGVGGDKGEEGLWYCVLEVNVPSYSICPLFLSLFHSFPFSQSHSPTHSSPVHTLHSHRRTVVRCHLLSVTSRQLSHKSYLRFTCTHTHYTYTHTLHIHTHTTHTHTHTHTWLLSLTCIHRSTH